MLGGRGAHLESSISSDLRISYSRKYSHWEEYKPPTSVQPLFILVKWASWRNTDWLLSLERGAHIHIVISLPQVQRMQIHWFSHSSQLTVQKTQTIQLSTGGQQFVIWCHTATCDFFKKNLEDISPITCDLKSLSFLQNLRQRKWPILLIFTKAITAIQDETYRFFTIAKSVRSDREIKSIF